jgi:hypothetical protein
MLVDLRCDGYGLCVTYTNSSLPIQHLMQVIRASCSNNHTGFSSEAEIPVEASSQPDTAHPHGILAQLATGWNKVTRTLLCHNMPRLS